jgi:heavy metal translocating P-type ATPase
VFARGQAARSSSTASRSQETWIALLSIGAITLHLVLKFAMSASPAFSVLPLYIALFIGGVVLLRNLGRDILNREIGADVLAGSSIITATLLGEYLVATIIVLMLSGGTALEHYATRRASSVLAALARRMPRTAHRRIDGRLVDVSLDAITVGETLVVLPHEVCPADGTVTDGRSTMDEAYLTGEPFEIAKTPGSTVLSGAINGAAALTIQVDNRPVDSRYAQIVKVIEAAEHNQPQLRRLGDRLGAWYTAAAFALATTACLATHDPSRFLAVIVVATPCPLLIAIPVAVIGAVSLSAARGIIIKKPAVLEQITGCHTLIFDKTGTLTYGRPSLTEIVTAEGVSADQVLRLAAGVEQYSKHPLAGAIVREAARRGVVVPAADDVSEKPGDGLRGSVTGHRVRITGRQALDIPVAMLPTAETGLECVVIVDDRYAALFRFHDEARVEAKSFVSHLRPRHGVGRIVLVSGDRLQEVEYLARTVGIVEVHAGKSPEQKLTLVTAEAANGPVLFVGDGINDAPAMLAATVGVAFGRHTDITTEAADAVVMEPSLERVDELIHIGRRMRRIALQSAVGGMALSGVGMLLAGFGYLPPLAGAVAQEAIDLLAVVNAVRVAIPREPLRDF